jgi:hypothetical protein
LVLIAFYSNNTRLFLCRRYWIVTSTLPII